MRKKPTGRKFRNLHARGSSIYYERVVRGERHRFSTETGDWERAAAVRDHYEAEVLRSSATALPLEVPRFAEFARRYLHEDTSHLAPTTRDDRKSYLREGGPLSFFSEVRLDRIDSPLLRQWWAGEIQARGLSLKTGRCYVDVLAAVLGYAVDSGVLEQSPTPAFRAILRRHSRTRKGRALVVALVLWS